MCGLPSWPRRLAAALLFCSLSGVPACAPAQPGTPLPTDAQLIAFLHAHQADFDSLRVCSYYRINDSLDFDRFQQWQRIQKRLGLHGGGLLDAPLIYIPVKGRLLGGDMAEAKGIAWLEAGKNCRFDTVASLDTISAATMRSRPGTRIRHVDGHWWLYRDSGTRGD